MCSHLNLIICKARLSRAIYGARGGMRSEGRGDVSYNTGWSDKVSLYYVKNDRISSLSRQ